MKTLKIFKIGSTVFFGEIEEFHPKDTDELCIVDRFPFKGNIMRARIKDKDIFICRNMTKEEFIDDALNSPTPMRVGKFLVPEFAEYLNITLDDLDKLKPLIEKIDEKHSYEKVIYDAYLENKGFYLTEEQKKNAFQQYKNARK